MLSLIIVMSFIYLLKIGNSDKEEKEAIRDFKENYQKCVEQTLYKKEMERMKKTNENQNEQQEVDFKPLMFETLKEMGCQPVMDENEDIIAAYQGEKFQIQMKAMFFNIWDLAWAQINVNDPTLPRVKEAINLTNFEFGPSVVLSQPNSEGIMYFHSRYGAVFHPNLPALNDYMAYVFNLFFSAKEAVQRNYQRLIAEEASKGLLKNPYDSAPCEN